MSSKSITTPFANALYGAVVAARRHGVIAPSTYSKLTQRILDVVALEARASVHPDWLEMTAKGVKHIESEFVEVMDCTSTSKFVQWIPENSLGWPLLLRALSAVAANIPSPFPTDDRTSRIRQAAVTPSLIHARKASLELAA